MSGFTFRLLRQAGGSSQTRSACAIVTTTSALIWCCDQQWNSQPKTALADNAPSKISKGSTSISKPVLGMKRLFETELGAKGLATETTRTKISNGAVMQRQDKISLHNSVLVIPNAIPSEYCQMLCDEADRLIQNGYHRDRMGEDDEDTEQDDLRRISTSDMSNRMQDLAMNIIKEDVLVIIEKELPSLLQSLSLSDWKRQDVEWEWASDEPTVNRYTAPGGTFEAHRDGYPLTIVIPLNDPSNFSGGGTRFFESSSSQEQSSNDHDGDDEPMMMRRKSVTISPPAGTAICFDGDMLHAGAPVLKGVRYVFVASFGILST